MTVEGKTVPRALARPERAAGETGNTAGLAGDAAAPKNRAGGPSARRADSGDAPAGGGPLRDGRGDAAMRGRVIVASDAARNDRLETRMALMLATRTGRKAVGLLLGAPEDKALLLLSCNDVHTVGMRRAIDVAFVDRAGLVVEAHRAVGPLRRLRNGKAVAVVERFASCETPWFAVGDQVMVSGGKEVPA